jgi:hypothetical protein
MNVQELFEAFPTGAKKFAPSGQADDHWALFVGRKKILTTKAGWDGKSGLCTWEDNHPVNVTDKQAISLLAANGFEYPKMFVEFYKKSADLFMNQPSKLADAMNKLKTGVTYSFKENGKTFTFARQKSKPSFAKY